MPRVVDSQCTLVVFFLFFLHSGRHNHTNKTSKIDGELKYAAENYSDCFGKAGGEKYSLKVSDWMTSKLRDTVRHVHELLAMSGEGLFVFFGFRGLGSFGPSCRGSRDWRGFPFFSPPLVFLVTGMQLRQYVASQCELLRPAGWQRENLHTHT